MLRGIASILVVLFHMTFNFSETFNHSFLFNVFNFGSSGVDIFFVLSGFIIAYANRDFVAQPTKTTTFLKRRFIRIYPIYWIIISVFLLIQLALPLYYKSHFELSAFNFLSTYLLLPDHAMINGVSWSLTNELFFYLLFTLAILIPVKKYSLYLLLAYFVLLLVVLLAGLDLAEGNAYTGLLFFPMNIEFLLGVFIVLIVDKINKRWIWPLLVTGTCLFLAGAYIFDHGIHNTNTHLSYILNRVVLFGFPSFLVILALVKMELNDTIRVKKIFLYLGDASYSIYLIHLPLVVAFYKVVAKLGIQNKILLLLLNGLLFSAVCFIGIIIYLKIEKPLIKKLNQRLLSKTK
ncbi:MAG: acyltransferase [Chitinophagaceae bacterium]